MVTEEQFSALEQYVYHSEECAVRDRGDLFDQDCDCGLLETMEYLDKMAVMQDYEGLD